MDEKIWFEDLAVGQRFSAGPAELTETDIIRYAAEFDPQYYHLDAEAAKASPFKGLAASGWHTASLAMRLIVEARPFGANPVLGLGVDELRWLAPVRPGDRLHLEGEVLSLEPPEGKSRGIARVKWVLKDQRGAPVYSVISINVVPVRR
jgi:acyl dehydratase